MYASLSFGFTLRSSFAKLISQNSKTQVILVKNQNDISNYFKKNLLPNTEKNQNITLEELIKNYELNFLFTE